MEALVQQLATHRIVSAGVQLDLYCVLLLRFSSGEREVNAGFSLKLPWNESVKLCTTLGMDKYQQLSKHLSQSVNHARFSVACACG